MVPAAGDALSRGPGQGGERAWVWGAGRGSGAAGVNKSPVNKKEGASLSGLRTLIPLQTMMRADGRGASQPSVV